MIVNKPEIREGKDTLYIDLMYPRIAGNISKVILGMCDVRATDSLLIEFDYDRNVVYKTSIYI